MSCIDSLRAGRAALVRLATTLPLAVAALLAGCRSAPAPQPPGRTPAPAVPATSAVPAGLPAPATPRSLDELRRQAARRLVAANPTTTYLGEVPNVLLAIPVLEVELHADGSIRRIDVLRYPRQAKDTTQLAIDAVRRAAPFGDVSRLPKPWVFSETFLFDDERRFKPRSLD